MGTDHIGEVGIVTGPGQAIATRFLLLDLADGHLLNRIEIAQRHRTVGDAGSDHAVVKVLQLVDDHLQVRLTDPDIAADGQPGRSHA